MTKTKSASSIWTPANIVTMVRICTVPLFMLVLLCPWPQWFGLKGVDHSIMSLIATGLFILISLTDCVDGYLARSRNEVTDFGKFMDPLADKILVVAALLALIELDILPSWPVFIILVREFIISGVRMLAATHGEVIAASWYGKAKTVFQMIAIVLFLIKDSLDIPNLSAALGSPLYLLSWAVMIIALVLTIISMIDYLYKARYLFGFKDPQHSNGVLPESAETIDELAANVISKAASLNISLATAESLTGGLISGALTAISGSSAVVKGGLVSYATEVKEKQLAISSHIIDEYGVVSSEVAHEMASKTRELFDVDIALSVTGIAGPTGAEPNKPIGTVWMGISTSTRTFTKEFHFQGDRDEIRQETVRQSLIEISSIIA